MRRAMTILEVSVATAALSLLLVMLLQTMISAGGFADSNKMSNESEQDIVHALDVFTDDIGNTAWFYKWDTTNGVFAVSPILPAIYPAGTSPGTLTSVNAMAGGTVSSNEFWFLKLRDERLMSSTTPSGLRVAHVDLDVPSATLSQYKILSGLTPAYSLILNSDANTNGNAFVAPVWESPVWGLDFPTNSNPDALRQYQYVLIPSVSYPSLGTLVRRYRNPTQQGTNTASGANASNWNTNAAAETVTIIDGVESVTFTYSDAPLLTTLAATEIWNTPSHAAVVPLAGDTHLASNQVRITLVLHRFSSSSNGDAKGRFVRKITHTVAMRSITNIGNE